jgi:superfamily I DNA/RNA helicase
MRKANELRRKAELFRKIKKYISDRRALQVISEVTDELELTAEQAERRERIRQRAHALWIAEGRPEGRAAENWIAAERELTESDGKK